MKTAKTEFKTAIFALFLIIACVMMNSCGTTQEFIFATDLTDGLVTADSAISFSASAMYGDTKCVLYVDCNGILLSEADGVYKAYLANGENKIEITAVCKDKTENRIYKITRQGDIDIQTDLIDGAIYEGESIDFAASAYKNGKKCNVEVLCNGVLLTENDGRFTAALSVGKNEIEIIAELESQTVKSTYTVTRRYESGDASEADGIKLTTDLIDGAFFAENELTFFADAYCGETKCDISVTCNGLKLSLIDGAYKTALSDGENIIEIFAFHGEKTLKKQFAINHGAVFAFITDIEAAPIVDDMLCFDAKALFNGEKCNFEIALGGKKLAADANGTYKAFLANGINTFVFTARSKDNIETKRYEIEYHGFEIVTDLESKDVLQSEMTFRIAAKYGDEKCKAEVYFGDEAIYPTNSRYDLTLRSGENRIVVVLKSENATKKYEYIVRYIDSAPTLSVSVTDSKTYRGSVFSFDVTARDGIDAKLAKDRISFEIDKNADDGVDSFAKTNGVSVVWDDSVMTSYRINFKSKSLGIDPGKPFLLKITADDGLGRQTSKVFRMTYVPANNGEKIGEIVFAIEGFSIECGYFAEPVRLDIYEGVRFSKTLTDFITAKGWTYQYTGTIDSGFYLACITGLDLTGNRIADGVWDFVKDRGYQRTIRTGASLGEFDYGSGSGWMYSVNGVYKNYGFADYYPQDGDCVRVQFTVILGEDLGGGGALGGGSTGSILDDAPDYAEIMWLLADIKADADADMKVYDEVLAAVSEWNISQKTMDELIYKLKKNYKT